MCRCVSLIFSCLIKAFLYLLFLSALLRIFLLLPVMLQIFPPFTSNWKRKWTWSRPFDSNIKICRDLYNYKNVKSLLDCSSIGRTAAVQCFRHLGWFVRQEWGKPISAPGTPKEKILVTSLLCLFLNSMCTDKDDWCTFKNVWVFVCLDMFRIILDYIRAVASMSVFLS